MVKIPVYFCRNPCGSHCILDRIDFVGSNQDCGLKSSCFLGCIGGFNFGEQTSIWKSLKFGFSTFGPVFDQYLGLVEQEQVCSSE